MREQILKLIVSLIVVTVIGVLGFMAFARRDHRVEMVVIYPKSPPSAVWALLTDHGREPKWLPAFGSVVRQPDIGGHEVWTHRSPDGSFTATVMTVSSIPVQRYERVLLRDGQPRSQSWDGRWVYELEAHDAGTRLTITEYGWTDGFPFYVQQRVLGSPDDFLKYYAARIGQTLGDAAEIHVIRSH